MQDLVELERRITAALERLARSVDLVELPAVLPEPEPVPEPEADAASDTGPGLPEQERSTLELMRERLGAAREREVALRAEYESRIEKLTRQLDVQGTELQRMRKTAISLRDELKRLREAEMGGQGDPALINRAMLTELDALRATRLTEMAELDELMAALDDHLTEAEHA